MVVAHIGANGHPLRLTGGGEHEERAADLDSSQRVRVHLVAYHLAPATRKKPIFTNLKKIFEHIELPAKVLYYFLRSNKSNINHSDVKQAAK